MTLIQSAPDDYILLGAVAEGRPAGALIASLSTEADVLLDVLYLYVAETFRRRGAATRLIDALSLRLPAGGPDGIRFVFSPERDAFDIDGFAILCFLWSRGMDCRLLPGGTFRTTLSAAAAGTFFASGIRRGDSEIYLPVNGIREADLSAFFAWQDMRLSAFSPDAFLPESRVIFADGKVVGLAAVSQADGGVELSWLGCDRDYAALLPGLIKNTFAALRISYPEETPVTLRAIHAASEKLASRLLPDTAFRPLYEANTSLLRWQIDAEVRAAVRNLPEADNLFEI
jgi:GNAT superfamily N-acetyltransferase